MSGVRVLVGTKKGAFVLTADGKRDKWNIAGPFFGGWEIYHLKGSPADPNRLYASQTSGWFGQMLQRSDDGGKSWEAVDNKFTYDGTTGYPSLVRRHPAPVGVQTRLAPGAVARRSRHRLRGGRGRRALPLDRRRQELAGARRPALSRLRSALAAGRRRHGSAHDPPRSRPPGPHLHRHLRRRGLSQRRRRHHLAADEPRPAVGVHARSRQPKSVTACTASPCIHRGRKCCSCRSTGT